MRIRLYSMPSLALALALALAWDEVNCTAVPTGKLGVSEDELMEIERESRLYLLIIERSMASIGWRGGGVGVFRCLFVVVVVVVSVSVSVSIIVDAVVSAMSNL